MPARRAVVVSLMSANGTPSSSARSAAWARSQAGVVHGRDPVAGAGSSPGPAGLAGGWAGAVGLANSSRVSASLREVADAVHAVGAGQRLPAAVGGGERAGVRGHQGPAAGRAAGGEQDDRDVPRRPPRPSTPRSRPASRMASRTRASTRVSGRLSAYSAYAAAVVTSSWPDDTARVKPSAPAGAQQRGEHRAGVRDQGDRAGGSGSGSR